MIDSTLPLESYRLLQFAGQAECFICSSGNTLDAELCRYCSAPMALASQATGKKQAPTLVATVGASGVGKTVYLGMLMDMLSRQPGGPQVLSRGAFSVSLQQTTIAALSRGEFPAKTPNEPDRWNWVHCQVRAPRLKRPIELIMPDLAGESLHQELTHRNTFPVIPRFLGKCSAVLVLIDTVQLDSGRAEQDFFAMKILSYLLELDDHPKTGWPRRPVAFVFTKADQCEECARDPVLYAQSHAPGLWQMCRDRLREFQFFAAGVAGACAYRVVPREGRIGVPLRTEPRGIVEPFQWLVGHLKT